MLDPAYGAAFMAIGAGALGTFVWKPLVERIKKVNTIQLSRPDPWLEPNWPTGPSGYPFEREPGVWVSREDVRDLCNKIALESEPKIRAWTVSSQRDLAALPTVSSLIPDTMNLWEAFRLDMDEAMKTCFNVPVCLAWNVAREELYQVSNRLRALVVSPTTTSDKTMTDDLAKLTIQPAEKKQAKSSSYVFFLGPRNLLSLGTFSLSDDEAMKHFVETDDDEAKELWSLMRAGDIDTKNPVMVSLSLRIQSLVTNRKDVNGTSADLYKTMMHVKEVTKKGEYIYIVSGE